MIGLPPRLLAPAVRRSRATEAGVVTLLLVALALADPDHPLPVDLCAFRYLTGLPCPTCGLTRALCHALRGHWGRSLGYHPAGILAATAFVGWVLWSSIEVVRGQPLADVERGRLSTSILAAGITIAMVNWLLQLVSARPFV